jgi:hypothetical protein
MIFAGKAESENQIYKLDPSKLLGIHLWKQKD